MNYPLELRDKIILFAWFLLLTGIIFAIFFTYTENTTNSQVIRVNLSGRLRMLSQKATKEFLLYHYFTEKKQSEIVDSLNKTCWEFNTIIKLLIHGNNTFKEGSPFSKLKLINPTDEEKKKLLSIQNNWLAFQKKIYVLLKEQNFKEFLDDFLIENLAVLNEIDSCVSTIQDNIDYGAVQTNKHQWILLWILLIFSVLLFIQYLHRKNLFFRLKESTLTQLTFQNLLGKLETHKKNLEVELESSKKHIMESSSSLQYGKMIGNIAHELKGPLTYVEGNIEYIREGFLPDLIALESKHPEIQENLEELLSQIDQLLSSSLKGCVHIRNLCESLLRTYRPSETGPVNLKIIIDTAVKITQMSWKYHCKTIQCNYPDDIPIIIEGYETQLIQVFTNLIMNSCDSIEEKKKLHPDNYHEGNINIEIEKIENSKLRIILQDDGIGIPEKILLKLGKEIVTSKESEKGTGLGMKIVQEIITTHKGTIQISNNQEAGARFEIQLPFRNPDE